ncbi:hypothetical protein N7537_010406 [Penicillium hordei]|uniref:MalT-like TPR region domain-containing protein n=1 Tax=Penicillium hordei TaxID=40994 RepID=A0AAD6DW32_9EURO|nr:uncharacterized protein N7537_010406 [Penicillium hordei]KAJ5593502.1 hypothetical protein N7537_010406 [Penicillium hordei]
MNGLSHIGTASSLVSGAEALLRQGNLEEATQNIYDADCILKLVGGMRSLEIRIKWSLARLSACRSDYVRAISRYENLIEEHQKNFGIDYKRLRTLNCELGDVYRDLGDMRKAEYYYKAGFATASRKTKLLTDTVNVSAWLVYGSLTRF